jgi:putative peptidoglycan lipid II flippase
LKLMLPRMTGIAVSQFNLMIITIFASTLAAGSLAVFNFSSNLQSVPLSVFGISFSIAVFPALSMFAARGEKEKFIQAFSETFRQILFFVIPLSIFMLVLRAQIVRVVLGAGKFDWSDTIMTFQCLGIFALSLFAQSAVQLLARSFYALQDTKTPFYVAIVTEAVNIVAVILLIGKFKVLGLAIAFSLASLVQMFLLLFILRTRFENLDDKNIIKSVVKIATASFAAGIGIQAFKLIVASIVNLNTFVGVFLQLSISGLVGFGIFVLVCHIMQLEEYLVFKQSLTRKLFRGKPSAIITESTEEVSGI